MATDPNFSEEEVMGLTGWDCLNTSPGSRCEYTYNLRVPVTKGYYAMTRAEVEGYITSGEITVSDLNGCFWTKTKSETDKEKCIKVLATLFSGNLISVYSIGKVLDEYWPGENKCG